jgi:hypothetical protein
MNSERLKPLNRIIPDNATAEELPELGVVIYRHTDSLGRPAARGFKGRAIKPSFNYYFANEAAREQYIKIWLQEVRLTVEAKRQRQAQKATFRHSLKVGDILVCCWGYDQTNVDYYEVVHVAGKNTVDIRETAQDSAFDSYRMTDRCVPAPGRYVGAAMRKRVQEGNRIRIESYACAVPLEYTTVAGKRVYQPRSFSSYA